MIIEGSGIWKSYGPLEVLKGIDISIQKSEIVSIVGASGAGKTTLLQILGTLDRPDKGVLRFDGIDVGSLAGNKLAAFRNRHVGFIFQFHYLLPEFSAIENVMMPGLISGKSPSECKPAALRLLDMMRLSERVNHKPSELSGGEQQRVAVARALMNQPSVVFADEPSGNLDSENAGELHRLFLRLRDELGQAFVIVTHNEELADLADRKLTMKDGRFITPEP